MEYIPALKLFFTNLTAFAVTFFLVYVPLAVVIGWLDYRKFAVPIDTVLVAKAFPWNRDLARALILIAEGKNREAIEVLRKRVE